MRKTQRSWTKRAIMRCRVQLTKKVEGYLWREGAKNSWEKSELDVDLMDGCLGAVEILQQRPSLLLSNVHLILQILRREKARGKKNRNYDFIFIPVFLFTTSSSLCSSSHPSIVSARLSSLISVCSLHFPWQVLDLRLQLSLLILKLQGMKMRFPVTKDWSLFDRQWEIHTFNASAYQFFAGSRLHVVGIRISVLQCVTTLWREQTASVSVWKHGPLCVCICFCRIGL